MALDKHQLVGGLAGCHSTAFLPVRAKTVLVARCDAAAVERGCVGFCFGGCSLPGLPSQAWLGGGRFSIECDMNDPSMKKKLDGVHIENKSGSAVRGELCGL